MYTSLLSHTAEPSYIRQVAISCRSSGHTCCYLDVAFVLLVSNRCGGVLALAKQSWQSGYWGNHRGSFRRNPLPSYGEKNPGLSSEGRVPTRGRRYPVSVLVVFEAHRDDPPLDEHEYTIVKERSHPHTCRTEDILHKVLPDRLRPRSRRRGQRQPAFGLYLHVA
jgi:hypothetical protein